MWPIDAEIHARQPRTKPRVQIPQPKMRGCSRVKRAADLTRSKDARGEAEEVRQVTSYGEARSTAGPTLLGNVVRKHSSEAIETAMFERGNLMIIEVAPDALADLILRFLSIGIEPREDLADSELENLERLLGNFQRIRVTLEPEARQTD
ncbi:hypothetical protein L218DRAFT_947627 [Marasmius fiardii PR-910]|nr:hypothetical protein L218DRAFT_947627 [Marasmius fiardii PR-910]